MKSKQQESYNSLGNGNRSAFWLRVILAKWGGDGTALLSLKPANDILNLVLSISTREIRETVILILLQILWSND